MCWPAIHLLILSQNQNLNQDLNLKLRTTSVGVTRPVGSGVVSSLSEMINFSTLACLFDCVANSRHLSRLTGGSQVSS